MTNKLDIQVSNQAFDQIQLIKSNDYTLDDMVFRLKIDGKGCSGFDYAMGFSPIHPEDVVLAIKKADEQDGQNIEIYIDPFTAFYCRRGKIDFILDIKNSEEGFHFENFDEKNFRGKFFKDETKTPDFK